MFGLIERIGEHQCNEQHGAFATEAASGAIRRRPARVEQRTNLAQPIFAARAARDRVAAITYRERNLCHYRAIIRQRRA